MASEDMDDLLQRVRGLPLEDQMQLLNAILDDARRITPSSFGPDPSEIDPFETPAPVLLPIPIKTQGFQIRVDLQRTKPPVWRRLILPGDLTLDEVHDVVQAAMGWTNSHLHRFRTGSDYRSPQFLTEWDISEGEEGTLENDVRLDQVFSQVGDRLWYDYDFGDNWEHVLKVEKVISEPPRAIELVTGRRACPPEDCGGTHSYEELAAWVESGYQESLLPDHFESAASARRWLPEAWHPTGFDVAECRDAVREAVARKQ